MLLVLVTLYLEQNKTSSLYENKRTFTHIVIIHGVEKLDHNIITLQLLQYGI